MGDNNIKLKSISELLRYKFFIPSYQRGYRWTSQQVEDLLNDVWEFSKPKKKDYEFYCLQPLVVKEMSDEDKQKNSLTEDEWYEVIDGQQRLTTIHIILTALKDAIEILGLPTTQYSIVYQRKNDGIDIQEFLNNIANKASESEKYIDYYFMYKAFETVNQWIKKNQINKGDFCNALLKSDYDDSELPRDKANNVRFIWYESSDEDPIQVFRRLNIGKIGLTNAELIKALFLNRSRFTEENKNIEHLKLRQQEIASEWDRIEYTLQNEEFWLFIHDQNYKNPTRIDFIFDLICEQKSLGEFENIGNDEYKTFRYFYEYLKKTESSIKTCWEKVKKYFQTFQEWFCDIELYHYIGYLLETKKGHSVASLFNKWNNSSDKKSFIKYLKCEIKQIVDACPLVFQFKEDGSDKTKCKPVLLFHNIQTVINQNGKTKENYGVGVFYKFPFHLYKKESWDVEHINSSTTNDEDDAATQNEWLLNVFLGVDDDKQKAISTFFQNEFANDEMRNNAFTELKNQLSIKDDEWAEEEKNRIWNYALLDSSTNRSYGNSIFSAKRRIIIGKDKGKLIAVPKISKAGKLELGKEENAASSFVPPCTKQVFMKYYSSSLSDFNYWIKEDAEAYKKDIVDCIEQLTKGE